MAKVERGYKYSIGDILGFLKNIRIGPVTKELVPCVGRNSKQFTIWKVRFLRKR